jgi:hypothetical protein
LEKRIFDFKTFAPSLLVEELEEEEEDIENDLNQQDSNSSQRTGLGNGDYSKYSDGLLPPFGSQSSVMEAPPFTLPDFLTVDEEEAASP